MPQSFIACDRDQAFLLPPSLLDWVSEDHVVWTIVGAVEEMDLSAFYGVYRADGHGRPAYEPAMMVALLLYAYARGNRSSRGIERECREDVAYRVICANLVPDHSTIAEFRKRHEAALADLFTSVLALCERAGLVKVGLIALDGMKLHANASQHANRDYRRIAEELLAEAERIDREEDERFGDQRGDELPAQLRTREGRRAALREAKRALEAERDTEQEQAEGAAGGVGLELEGVQRAARDQGRRGWLRGAKQQLDAERAARARPIPRSRPERLREGQRLLEEEQRVLIEANAAYEAYRARGVMKDGRRFGRPPDPYMPPEIPEGVVNITDPDSRNVKSPRGYVQGYNVQAVVSDQQIVLAAEVTTDSPDFGHLEPMVNTARAELAAVGVTERPGVVVADAGYWHHDQMDNLAGEGITVLIPPDAGKRKTARPGWQGGRYSWMRHLLETERGHKLYRRRQVTVEPVFAHTKFNRKIDRFQRRGRTAVRSEWRLITATHNLLKLHSHRIATAEP
jgi:transposase